MSPVVSVILPTFNRLKYLRAAIQSVLEQTFQDWELLIADDGSDLETRNYLQVVESPPRIRVMWLTHCGRPSVVRNAALRAARGEYVAFLDSDDLWLPTKLDAQISSLRRCAGRQWSQTRFVLVDEWRNPTAWQRARGWPVLQGWIRDQLIKGETVIAVPAVVVCRELLEQVGGFDEQLIMSEDYDLWLRLAARSEIDAVDEPLTLVTRHGEHSGSDVISFEDDRRVIEKMLRTAGTEHLHPVLFAQRAEVAVGLARSLAARGERLPALRTLAASARNCWRYPHWWFGALGAGARAFAPPAVRRLAYWATRRTADGLRR